MIDANTFASDPAAIFYGPLLRSQSLAFDRLFELLNDLENVQCLVSTAADGRPALDGVVVLIEADPDIRAVLDSDGDSHQFRKAVGVAVRQKMEEIGWQKNGETKGNVTNSTLFTRSQLYVPQP